VSNASDGGLFEGERVYQTSLYPMLAHHLPGSVTRPLLVFVPGGGHLARIGYGHPGGRRDDFLAHWLNRVDFEVLSVSYPSEHAAISASAQTMTITQWAQCIAEVVTQIIDSPKSLQARPIVLIGWSMAGRLARSFAVAAHNNGLTLRCFISLAATAPIPNLTTPREGGESVTELGFWDASTRLAQWEAELTAQEHLNSRVIIPRDIYQRHYRCHNPVLLRAEIREQVPAAWSMADILDDLGTFGYEQYPLCAAIVPTSAKDARHVLTDQATWTFINSQMIYCNLHNRSRHRLAELDEVTWLNIRRHVAALPDKLFREMNGGHFFFVGERGARQTAAYIDELVEEAATFLRWRDSLFLS
jgi:surfactin synthase thioesterase subunit